MIKNVVVWMMMLLGNHCVDSVLSKTLCEVVEVLSSTPTREQYYDRYYSRYKYKEVYEKLYDFAVCHNGDVGTDFKFEIDTSAKLKYLIFKNVTIKTIPVHLFASLESLSEIYLNSSGVDTIQPGAFTGLSNLQQIHLQNNNITALSAGIFNSLTKLEYINAANNILLTMEEHTFLGVVNLKTLDLHNNRLSSIMSKSFANLQHLEYVDLSQNFITNITSDLFSTNRLLYLNLSCNNINNMSFSFLPNSLTFLNLSHNIITELANFSNLNSLQQLDLSYNKISQISTNFEIQNVTTDSPYKLTELDISHNLLTHITLNSFYGLQELTKLSIDNNMIDNISIGSLHYLQSLNFLNLSNNNLRSVDYGTFGNLEHVLTLDLSNNFLSDFRESTLHALGNLENLNISHNHISHIDVSYLIDHCSHLQEISLHNNPWDCMTLGKLVKEFEKRNVTVSPGPTKLSQHVKGISCHNPNVVTELSELANTVYPSPTKDLPVDHPLARFDTVNDNINKTLSAITDNFYILESILKNLSSTYSFDNLDHRFKNSKFYKFFTSGFNETDFVLYINKLNLDNMKNQTLHTTSNNLDLDPSFSSLTHSDTLDNILISFKNEVTIYMILFIIALIAVVVMLVLLYLRIRSQDQNRLVLQRYQGKRTCCDAELELI